MTKEGKARKEKGYVNSNSKNGTSSIHLDKDTTAILDIICRLKNVNKARFVKDLILKYLEENRCEAMQMTLDEIIRVSKK